MLVCSAIEKNEDTLPVSLQEVSDLFRHIRSSLSELDGLERSAQVMEDELQTFLESYYSRVLPLTARLERLRHRKEYGVFPKRSLAMDISTPEINVPINMIAQKRKALFRQLVKQCHPDNRDNNAPVGITEVYEAKTIGTLWLLVMRCGIDTLQNDDTISRYLEQQRAEIGQLTLQARARIRQMQQTDQWELKERVSHAALEGINLIQLIEQRIENQIAALQQIFVMQRPATASRNSRAEAVSTAAKTTA